MVSTSLHSRIEWSGVPPLPAPLNPLIGRDDEVARVMALLSDPGVRLITLSGPGGVGKTRLALRVAAAFDPSVVSRAARQPTPFPAGVGFVPLASITDHRLVASAIGRALQIPHDDLPAFDAVVDTLGTRRMLLVLDNVEQVMSGASLITELLTACSGLKVLVTSRSVLRVSGEYDVRVAPLGLPASNAGVTLAGLSKSDAALLFMERSRAALAGGSFTDSDAPAIAEICTRLDGLPLAIELAAARVSILSPQMLAERLDRRLPLLTGGARDLPARQQTLRGAIAWSDDLLLSVEQWLFHRLAVFSSGFTLEAVTDLLAHTPDGDEEGDATPSARALELVTSLMGHSLLIRHSPAGGTPRFAMLGTVREYAADCLQADGELEPARREHARYMLALALRAMSEFSGPDQRLWIERIEADHDNVRAALLWSLEHDANLALQLSSALWRFWEIRGYLLEGQSWLERALAARGAVSDRVEATALNNLGNLTYRLSDYTRARRLYEQSLDISRDLADLTDVADSLNNLGLVASAQRDYQAARNFLGESLTLRREEARPDRLSLALHNLGEMEIEAGNPSRAPALLDEALALRQRRGDERGVAYVQYNLGRASLALGDRSGGKDSLRQALTTFRDVGEKIGLADALLEIGFLELERSHEQGAVKALDEGLRLRIDLGDKRGVLACLEAVADLALSRGRHAISAKLIGAINQQRTLTHIPAPFHRDTRAQRTTEIAERSLGQSAYREHTSVGASWTLAKLIDAAFEELGRKEVTDRASARTSVNGPAFTARELDVMRLLAQGLSDRDIAAELRVSPRTASTHVTNILHKLGESSRSAAAAYAVRHNLAS